MNKQEVFDTVVNHLRQQRCKAVSSEGSRCAYRGDGRTKCAVGAVIPDDEYGEWMEGQGVVNVLEDPRAAALRERLTGNVEMLTQLQAVHDFHMIEEWERDFQNIASWHGLTYTPGQQS
jgi:hypothetical protein